MTNPDRHAQWDAFLAEWPAERLGTMTLDEYTNDKREDALVYWLEFRTQDLGGIRGGSAFKFGIARRSKKGKKKKRASGRAYSANHLWQTRYGATAEEAFEGVRRVLVDIVDAVRADRLEVIDTLPLSPIVKWKLAFLYQPREKARIFPLFKRECLLFHYQKSVDPNASDTRTGVGQMYRALSERLRRLDVFERADGLWHSWRDAQQTDVRRDWLVPLMAFGINGELAEQLCQMERVDADHLPLSLKAQLESRKMAAGDRVALLDGALVKARGVIESGEPPQWTQQSCRRKPVLERAPGEVLEIDTWKVRDGIWGVFEEDLPEASPIDPPTNRIFFGPPGTGKTREAMRRALGLCGVAIEGLSDSEVSNEIRVLQGLGRVEIVTFHPSYGYEEFVEGIRPVLGSSHQLGYRCVDGAFKRIALRAASEGLELSGAEPDFDLLWGRLTADVVDTEGDYLIEALDGGIHALTVTPRGHLEARRVLSVEEDAAWVAEGHQAISRELVRLIWQKRAEMDAPDVDGIKALVSRYKPRARFSAPLIGPVLRALTARSTRALPTSPEERREAAREAFQSTEGVPWHFSSVSEPHVLIVDEINRGDLSRIMGELITLLEPERRLGASDAMVVRLSVSGERFAAPPNLHVLGTMNTADRSIAMMDVALRRRFVFEEKMPDASVVSASLAGSEASWRALVTGIFEAINTRIRFLYDREHQIGHAYFLGANNSEALRRIMVERVFPLLQEYFYDAWESICLVLGCPYDEVGRPARTDRHAVETTREGLAYKAPMIRARVLREEAVLRTVSGEREDRVVYGLHESLLSPGLDDAAAMAFWRGILGREP